MNDSNSFHFNSIHVDLFRWSWVQLLKIVSIDIKNEQMLNQTKLNRLLKCSVDRHDRCEQKWRINSIMMYLSHGDVIKSVRAVKHQTLNGQRFGKILENTLEKSLNESGGIVPGKLHLKRTQRTQRILQRIESF